MERLENPRLMEPLLPPEGTRVLEDLAVELASVAAALAGKLSEETVCARSTSATAGSRSAGLWARRSPRN
jgi:hypothetical protein